MVDIIDSVQLDDPGSGLVDLFELEMDSTTTIYLCNGLDGGVTPLYFPNQAGDTMNEYIAIPIQMEGVEYTSEGAQARPTLTIANLSSATTFVDQDTTLYDELEALNLLGNENLIGKKITRRRTLVDHLYAELDTPEVPQEFPIATYIIDRITAENNIFVEFEITSPIDMEGIVLPNRVIIGKYCSWEYQGYFGNNQRGGCYWKDNSVHLAANGSGGAGLYNVFFDKDDRPCINSSIAMTYSYPTGSPYDKDDLVSYDGKKWRCNGSSVSSAPSETDADWQVFVEWTDWNSVSTYNYSAPPRYTCIKHNAKLWTPKQYVPANKAPIEGSPYWARFDLCGKTTNSCKIRFQAIPIDPGTRQGNNFVPSADLNTDRPLPFGGFPGTLKFR